MEGGSQGKWQAERRAVWSGAGGVVGMQWTRWIGECVRRADEWMFVREVDDNVRWKIGESGFVCFEVEFGNPTDSSGADGEMHDGLSK